MNSVAELHQESAVESAPAAVTKPRLLVCVDWFDPGVRAGGPIRSCVNLAALLGSSADLGILTSDRDLGEDRSYDSVSSDRWTVWRSCARVRYCSSGARRCAAFAVGLRRFCPQAVYLNGMFSVAGTLFPLFWLRVTRQRIHVLLAPRGMLKLSALQQKGWKKRPLIRLLRFCGVLRHTTFHATSAEEADEIRQEFGAVPVQVVPNVPCLPVSQLSRTSKEAGDARFCFVGRIHPTKNLLWLIRLLRQLDGACRLLVVGPLEDHDYHQRCLAAVAELPARVQVDFVGVKSESEVRDLLLDAHAMVLPTLGENFGHAIFESLAVGTPVIISDRTVWRALPARQAGWDLPLDQPDQFVKAMNTVIGMKQEDYHRMQEAAFSVACDFFAEHDLLQGYMDMFFGATPTRVNGQPALNGFEEHRHTGDDSCSADFGTNDPGGDGRITA